MGDRSDSIKEELDEIDKKLSMDGSDFGYDNYDNQQQLRVKADFKPEVFFVGQILGGDGFENQDGLFLEVIFKHGEHWQQLTNVPPIQTHS